MAASALRMEYDFQGRAGYAVAHRAFTLPPLPAYWAMSLWVRGEGKPNTLELKLIDSTGLNVWWMRRPALHVGRGWTQLRFRPKDLTFAWGPLGGGPPRGIAALEIAYTAGQGGAGWLALDQLGITTLGAPVPDRVRPSVTASSSLLSRPPRSCCHRISPPRRRRRRATATRGDGEARAGAAVADAGVRRSPAAERPRARLVARRLGGGLRRRDERRRTRLDGGARRARKRRWAPIHPPPRRRAPHDSRRDATEQPGGTLRPARPAPALRLRGSDAQRLPRTRRGGKHAGRLAAGAHRPAVVLDRGRRTEATSATRS